LREGAPEIWAMNADGSGEVRLTPDNTYNHASPSWTPDGTKILWANDYFGTYDIWQMNADGSGQAKVGGSDTEHDTAPVASPDGTKIAFVRRGQELWVMDSDGTNEHKLADGIDPDWSPDGTKIAFTRPVYDLCSDDEVQVATNLEIFKMNADGTGVTRLTHSGAGGGCFSAIWDTQPGWSPDGTKIAWTIHTESFSTSLDPDHQVAIMDANGTFLSTLGNEPLKADPDWQPVQPGYPRPKGATPFRVALVPAYVGCFSPNRTHGPPLAFSSCNPPQERSGVLTVGTPDANGAAPGFAGSVRFETMVGNPATPADEADVAVSISLTDVRCRATNAACSGGPLSDYAGRLLAVPTAMRITDRLNTPPGPVGGPGTGAARLELPFDCTATADPASGATCTLATTVDSVIPGSVREGKRSIWELGQVHVRDAGPNGTGYESPACPPTCGDGDETLFLRQGVFVP